MSHKIPFREHGQGPILILLHGYGGSVMQWDGVVERLRDSYRVVVPNLSHLYMSQNRLLFPMIIEHVGNFIEANFPGERVSVAGMSFGGMVAWGLALQRPALVDRLVLLNPLVPHPVNHFRRPELRYFFVLPMSVKSVLRTFETPIGEAFLKTAVEIFRPDREMAGPLARLKGRKLAFVADLVAHFAWILRSEDWKFWEKRLEQNQASTLMIWSQDDPLFTEDSYRDFAMLSRAGQALTWAAGGHILSRSKPDEVAIAISEFLRLSKAA
ncbi:MAG: alpha/beta hydrolase [Bdellovibrionaceae bacterium]|nr:alpha/beta hydrolase [Pseudobdellovibrionaceae bacterium]MBX3034216.1 alpha/beta hydrolase [Pseudobdellovibrionaceae bacterium]